MLETARDAKAKLEGEGLYVSCPTDHSLWIAATVSDIGDGVMFSTAPCSLICNSGRWVAVFPAEGCLTYEVPGTLPELVPLITSVYADYRRTGGQFKDAFRRVTPDAEQYLVGRSPAPV